MQACVFDKGILVGFTKVAQVDALTGLRGIAALWVVIFHKYGFDAARIAPIRHGYLAVDVFFILSGLVMALNYSHLFRSGFDVRKFAAFLLRRVARIYPLYFAVTLVLIAILLRKAGDDGFSRGSFTYNALLNIFLVQSWGLGSPIDGPSWSISTEMAAYLLFPLLISCTIFRSAATAFVIFIICGALLLLLASLPAPPSYPFPRQGALDIAWEKTPWPLLRCLAEFTLGLLAYRIAGVSRVFSFIGNPYFGIMLTVWILVTLLTGLDVAFVLAIPLLIVHLCSVNPWSHLLASGAAVVLGELSYAIYLVHFPLLRAMSFVEPQLTERAGPLAADALAGVSFFAVLLLVSWLSTAS